MALALLSRLSGGILALFLFCSGPLAAQSVQPRPPKEYDVKLSYDIDAPAVQYPIRFTRLIQRLKDAGLQLELDETDPDVFKALEGGLRIAPLTGRLSSNRMEHLLLVPSVRTVILIPRGFKPPEKEPVLAEVLLNRVTNTSLQRGLAEQTGQLLTAKTGFVQKVGYDSRQYTRILGTIPAKELDKLLLGDIRTQPGDRVPPAAATSPLSGAIRSIQPIKAVRVFDLPDGVPESKDEREPAPPRPGEEWLEKVSPELRPVVLRPAVAAEDKESRVMRFEVVLADANDRGWRTTLTPVPGVTVEGQLGSVVSILAPRSALREIAGIPSVANIRNPRMAESVIRSNQKPETADVLATSGLDKLHALGYRGRGVRIAIIDSSFAGWQAYLGKGLPQSATLIDLTSLRNTRIEPEPDQVPKDSGLGHGTAAALSAAMAAPEAQLVLIRIDPTSAFMLMDLARYLDGEGSRSTLMNLRYDELLEESRAVESLAQKYGEDRKRPLASFDDFDIEGARARKALEEAGAKLAAAERAFRQKLNRLIQLELDLQGLKNVRTVACSMTWNEGHPIGDSSVLDRWLDEKVSSWNGVGRRHPVWFHGIGDIRDQVWGGLYRDADGNGVMEFGSPETELPAGRWTSELCFLAWRSMNNQSIPDLPAGIRVRAVLQWTEVRDGQTLPAIGSQANLRLLALRQRDPSGQRVGTDDLNVVARSQGPALFIGSSPRTATFEQAVEIVVDSPGRFALRIEGQGNSTMRVPQPVSIPASERYWELRTRLFVQGVGREDGRVVLGEFATTEGGPGMPADAFGVETVGLATASAGKTNRTLYGSYPGQGLRVRPTFLSFGDGIRSGGASYYADTGIAAAFAAGTWASVLRVLPDNSPERLLQTIPGGAVFQVPPQWIDSNALHSGRLR